MRRSVPFLIVAAVIAAGLVGWRALSRDGADRAFAAVTWPGDCPGTEIMRPARSEPIRGWDEPQATATLGCEGDGEWIAWARFDSADELESAVLAHRPPSAVCIAGNEALFGFVSDAYVAKDDFADACEAINGDVVDQGGRSWEEGEIPNTGAAKRRAAAKQAAALKTYFAEHPAA